MPDPDREGKRRQAWIFAFLDDHSRLVVGSRWSFRQNQPAMEIVLRRALQRHGQPGRIYVDNGSVYRARHMARICGELGVALVFCTAYRPEGKGKIERLWKTAVNPFVAEVGASSIRTIEALNEAWLPWLDRHYHQQLHGETGMKPPDRWRVGIAERTWVDEERLRAAFRWEEQRKPDKTGRFSLLGQHYQVRATPVRGKVKVRFDPEDLTEVEVVGADGRLLERLQPMTVHEHRRPRVTEPVVEDPVATIDYLAHMVEQARPTPEPPARQLAREERRRREQADDAVVTALAAALDPAAFDEAQARAWLVRFGPLDPDVFALALPALLARLGPGTHVQVLLDHHHKKERP